MSSKNKILANIRAAGMEKVALPEIPGFPTGEVAPIAQFQKVVESVKGIVYRASEFASQDQIVAKLFPEVQFITSTVAGMPGNVDLQAIKEPIELKDIDVAIIKGQVGVAENGAIWISEKEMVHRVLPFITQHLMVVLDESTIVSNMHEAYQKIKVDETGFGVFVAGPSKTADIEQSLVIGAQGARSLTVIIV